MFYCCGITNKGNRDHNEDALMIHKAYITEGTLEEHIPSPFIAAVADGVAGEQAGELASSLCLRLLSNIKYNHTTDLKERINDVHEVLVQYGLENGAYLNMQTTLCGVAIDENDRITTFNVGDSRLYRYRNAMIRQLSRDQSLVQLLYEKGTITSNDEGIYQGYQTYQVLKWFMYNYCLIGKPKRILIYHYPTNIIRKDAPQWFINS